MSVISINQAACKKCGLCSEICVDDVFLKTNSGEFPLIGDDKHCINCGHCVAICPHGAVINSRMRIDNFNSLAKNSIDLNSIENFLRNKRSTRHFKNTEISKEKITRLLNLAQQAPSDTNCQDRKYIVVTDRKKIDEMENLVVKYYKNLMFWMSYPVRKFLGLFSPNLIKELEKVLPDFISMVRKYENGEKPVFRNAPCVIFILGSKGNIMSKDNCIISQDYLMLGAETMGLGSCVIGYATGAPGSLDKYLKIPKNQKLHCAFIIGNPIYNYYNGVDRNEPEVVWL